MMPTRSLKVLALLERDEENVRAMARSRAKRLANLISLRAPDWVIASELLMVMEAIEAIFRKHEYNPNADDRVFREVDK